MVINEIFCQKVVWLHSACIKTHLCFWWRGFHRPPDMTPVTWLRKYWRKKRENYFCLFIANILVINILKLQDAWLNTGICRELSWCLIAPCFDYCCVIVSLGQFCLIAPLDCSSLLWGRPAHWQRKDWLESRNLSHTNKPAREGYQFLLFVRRIWCLTLVKQNIWK